MTALDALAWALAGYIGCPVVVVAIVAGMAIWLAWRDRNE
jgi:hypothetical protein